MTKRILITGGSGFIGSRLIDDWLQEGHQVMVLSRQPGKVRQRWQGRLDAVAELDDLTGEFDWLVNLAGAGIADQRWTEARKRELRDSRIALTDRLVQWASQTGRRFERVLSGSAIGYYGSYDNAASQPVLSEASSPATDFAAQLCADWEAAAAPLEALTEQLVYLRTGVVWGPRGGMLGRLWLPFKLGAGGRIGTGEQVLSWIHIDDYRAAIHWLLASGVTGPVNMTSPHPVTNGRFTRLLASTLSRPALLPMPSCGAQLAFGEMSVLLLKGQRVEPDVLLQSGFEFRLADPAMALADIHARW